MLTGQHYQNAYLCDDIEAAIAHMRGSYSFGDVPIIDVDQKVATPSGLKQINSRIAFIWIDNLQIELIQPIVDETGIYKRDTAHISGPNPVLHFHHSCARVSDWDKFRAAVDQQDLPLMFERADGGTDLKYLYLDARALCGHYLEFTWMTDAMWQRLGGAK